MPLEVFLQADLRMHVRSPAEVGTWDNLQGKQARLKAKFHSHGPASALHAAMYSAPDAVVNIVELCGTTRRAGASSNGSRQVRQICRHSEMGPEWQLRALSVAGDVWGHACR